MLIKRSGVKQARRNLTALLERASRGQPSVVTKHGRVYAAIVPVHYLRLQRGPNMLGLRGTGKGLWGRSAAGTIRGLRVEWD
jgi:prevent-host-death family protein